MGQYKIEKGKILVYRVYDIGEEINLEVAEKILQDSNRSRIKLKKVDTQSIIIKNDPLKLSLGLYPYGENNQSFAPEVSAKIWAFGTISILFEYAIPPQISLEELNQFSLEIQSHEQIDLFARSKASEISMQIKDSMAKVTHWDGYEDYIIYFIEQFDKPLTDANDLLAKDDVASLILNEHEFILSEQIKDKIYSNKLQYLKNDLAVIDWNSAVIVEPSGSLDIANVIEFALNQLLEMRYYDEMLDEKLQSLYSAAELKDMSVFSSQYSNLALEASQKYIEIAEIVESVENSLKIIGDLYYATVFRTASTKFRFPDWQVSIDNKLDNMAKLSELLLDNLNSKRSHLLEIVIILLISIELIPFLGKFIEFFK